MGLDLALLPFYSNRSMDLAFSHDILQVRGISYDLCDELMDLEKEVGFPVPDNFTSYLCRDDEYEDPHYGETTETPYGNRLMYLHARHIKKVLEKAKDEYLGESGYYMGYPLKSVIAFVNELPDDLPIALYWH